MMEFSFILRAGNSSPVFGGTDINLFLKAWKEMQAYFTKPKPMTFSDEGHNKYHFSLDASDVIISLNLSSTLELNNPDSFKELEKRWKERELIGAEPYSSDIIITIKFSGNEETINIERAVYRFLQQLFATMNISCPGSLNMLYSEFSDNEFKVVPPNLCGDMIEAACNTAITDEWPKVSNCDFKDVWNWLEIQNFNEIDFATTTTIKDVFALLTAGVVEHSEESTILALARAFEALFVDGRDNIQKVLKQRLTLILGEPNTNKKWLTSFYNLRSDIAHGRTMIRPASLEHNEGKTMDKIMNEYVYNTERAIAVLISILQDLVNSNSNGYQFTQKVIRSEITKAT